MMRLISVLLATASLTAVFAQTPPGLTPPPDNTTWERATAPYRAPSAPPPVFSNSQRVYDLIRAGNLYLSLPDAIALALENNLDLELQRTYPAIAETDLLRAHGGGVLRGINFSVNEAPSGVGGPGAPLVTSAATGTIAGATSIGAIQEIQLLSGTQSSLAITGTSPLSTGPPIPVFDPSITGALMYQHQATAQTNTIITGTNSLIARNTTGSIGVQTGFVTGTQLSANFTGLGTNTNSLRSTYNPYSTTALGFNLVQPLLRGFGPGINRRYIRIANNDRALSDLVFRNQAIATVAGVIRLYYDLVSLSEDLKVRRQTLALAQQLYENNRLQVEQGTLAPLELVRAQAQIAGARLDVANGEGYVLQQELILKSYLTRSGTIDPAVRAARIVPTSPITIPQTEEARPVQDLTDEAFRNRPEIAAAGLQIENSRISLEGSRNELLPELDLVGTVQGSGLAGQVNPLTPTTGSPFPVATPDLSLVGGVGSALGQIFSARYPTYSVGLQLNLPIRNRIAQADVARDELMVKQTEIRRYQLEKQVRVEVENALIALNRARAAYDAAMQARTLQEQSLSVEQEKYEVGLSTNFLVIQYQNFLAQARATEVAARSAYIKARTALDRATGTILSSYNVSIDEALQGRVSRPPSAIPVVPPEPVVPATPQR